MGLFRFVTRVVYRLRSYQRPFPLSLKYSGLVPLGSSHIRKKSTNFSWHEPLPDLRRRTLVHSLDSTNPVFSLQNTHRPSKGVHFPSLHLLPILKNNVLRSSTLVSGLVDYLQRPPTNVSIQLITGFVTEISLPWAIITSSRRYYFIISDLRSVLSL